MLELTQSSLSISEFRLSQRTTVYNEPLREVLLPGTPSQNQRPHERQRSAGLAAAQIGSKPLHHQKLEKLCESLGDELWRTDPAGASNPGFFVPQPHPGVPVTLQPEDGHWAHWTLPHLSAHWCAATAAELDREGLAVALATHTLINLTLNLSGLYLIS